MEFEKAEGRASEGKARVGKLGFGNWGKKTIVDGIEDKLGRVKVHSLS